MTFGFLWHKFCFKKIHWSDNSLLQVKSTNEKNFWFYIRKLNKSRKSFSVILSFLKSYLQTMILNAGPWYSTVLLLLPLNYLVLSHSHLIFSRKKLFLFCVVFNKVNKRLRGGPGLLNFFSVLSNQPANSELSNQLKNKSKQNKQKLKNVSFVMGILN